VGLHQEERSAGQEEQADDQLDDTLKAVFGGKKTVNMFEMTKLVSKHVK
jgi:chromatin remodeling complex protein RSC6